jgi:hypothetical protein
MNRGIILLDANETRPRPQGAASVFAKAGILLAAQRVGANFPAPKGRYCFYPAEPAFFNPPKAR